MLNFNTPNQIDVLELGSGTGLGGLHFTALTSGKHKLVMTDICEKSLKLIKKNIEGNKLPMPELA